jgi:predicted nucleic acid-binding Zn ribbon protein
MFRRDVKNIKDLVMQNLRENGLETPLLQKRLVDAWPEVAGPSVARFTREVSIYNQVLYVKLSSPVLRTELSMRRQTFIDKLNHIVGARIITDVRFN